RICYIYTKCGHAVPMVRHSVECDNRNCKFSRAHPSDCNGSKCKQTCWQYRQYPQQYSPHIAAYCPSCLSSST
ncbi:hypothetical protein OBBRIDRAFT_738484, partial [Obba rivulosa]